MELEKEIFKDGMPKGYYTQNDNGKYVMIRIIAGRKKSVRGRDCF